MAEQVKITGAQLIVAERERQIVIEQWTAEHDDDHTDGSLAQAAASYALGGSTITNIDASRVIDIWPASWGAEDKRIADKSRVRQLVVAGALIAAEIDRLLRADATITAREGME
jgi:hypothetical protein